MKIRHPFLLAFAVLCAATLAVLNLDRSLYMSYFEQQAVALISKSGVRAAFRDFSAGTSGLTAEGLSLFYPRYLLGLELENVRLSPSLLSTARLKPSANLDFTTCGGTFSGRIDREPGKGLTSFAFSLQNMELASHQQLNGLGIESGSLSAQSERLEVLDTQVLNGDLTVDIKGFSRPRAGNLPLKFTKMPFPVQIPAISSLDLAVVLKFSPESVGFEKLVCKSQIGNFYGSGSLKSGPDRKPRGLRAEITANLNDDGYALLKTGSQLVRLKGGNPLNDPANAAQRNWRIKVSGLNPPEFELAPAQ